MMAFISTSIYGRELIVKHSDDGYVHIHVGDGAYIGVPLNEVDALIDNLYEAKRRTIANTPPAKIAKMFPDQKAEAAE
jgi:hypothetical protein